MLLSLFCGRCRQADGPHLGASTRPLLPLQSVEAACSGREQCREESAPAFTLPKERDRHVAGTVGRVLLPLRAQ